ncbi:MAG: DUF86 domain-containing protein [Acidobacteria bacterium]|nr:DUF86 domain-containing protein [Acidobacteriota bacterium]
MQRDLDRLEDILAATGDIVTFTQTMDFDGFVRDRRDRYAILHALTIIGEASHQLSAELRERHNHVPWRRIIDFRHRVVHGYSALDATLVWEVSIRLVPELREQIERILAAEFPPEST